MTIFDFGGIKNQDHYFLWESNQINQSPEVKIKICFVIKITFG